MEFEEEDVMTELIEFLRENEELAPDDEEKTAEFIESFAENEALTTNERKLAKLIRLIAENKDLSTYEQKTEKESESILAFPQNLTEISFSWKEIMPQLIRRMNMPHPPLPNSLLNSARDPQVLWYIMRRMAFDSTEKVKRSLKSKHAIRTLFWKAALAAMFGSFDASCILKHAAMRLIRNDLKSAFQLYNVAMTHILRKLMFDINKGQKIEKIKTREVLSKTEIIPVTFRKHRRKNKKVCKVKALWIHYLFRNRSLIKKPYRVIDAELKDSLTEIAFSDTKNRYPRKKICAEDIFQGLEISDYEDELTDYDYQLLKSDDDNKYLWEDIKQILNNKKIQNKNNFKQNGVQLVDSSHSGNSNEKHKCKRHLHRFCSCRSKSQSRPKSYITKLRLDNFFREFHHCPLLKITLEQYFATGKLKDWVDEIDLPMLVNDIKEKDKLSKFRGDYSMLFTNIDETLCSTFEDTSETTKTDDPLSLQKYVYGDNYWLSGDAFVAQSDSNNEKNAELLEELKSEYISLLKQENDRTNADKGNVERNIYDKDCNKKNIDDPCDELCSDDPCDALNIDEPCDELNIDEPWDELNIDEPCDELNIDEPCDKIKTGQTCEKINVNERYGERNFNKYTKRRGIDKYTKRRGMDEYTKRRGNDEHKNQTNIKTQPGPSTSFRINL